MAPINTTATENIYRSLIVQLDKLARHNRQGSYRTKERYYEACKRFCKFLAEEYHLQKLSNISGKHLTAYVEFLQATDKAASTVKTDLAAIRFFHDKMDNAKYRLPDNGELSVELEKRTFGGTDCTWSAEEFDKMFAIALVSGQNRYACALALARFAGLRLHECFRIDTATARQALREKAITIKGKGGKVRTVPIEDARISMTLRPLLAKTRNGGKLLVSDDLPTHIAMQRAELDPLGSLLIVILFTGLRESEAIGLTWDCVDFRAGTVKVCKQLQKRPLKDGGTVFAPLKNNKTRILKPAPYVMDILSKQWTIQTEQRLRVGELWRAWTNEEERQSALVYTTPEGNDVSPTSLRHHFKKLVTAIGAPNVRVHDLRHTFAVLSLQNGDDIKTVQGNLGHATAAFTLDVYRHVSERMKDNSAARMQAYIDKTTE